MNFIRQPAAAWVTTLLLSFVSQPGFGGAITSANAPMPPPPPIIPGVIKLSCSLSIATFYDVFAAPKFDFANRMNVSETHLDYEKAEGKDYFTCVEGCEKPVWNRFRHEWPAGEVRPIPKVTLVGQINFPWLRLKIVDSKLFLQTMLSSAHRSWTGSIVKNEKETVQDLERDEFYANAATDENVESTEIPKLLKLAKTLNRDVTSSARSNTELRCTVLKPGQVSEAQIDKILALPPAAGTISAREYESATSMSHISQPYENVLKLARNLDPAHRKALIAKFLILRKNIDFLKPVAGKVREAVKAYPQMTAENAWGYIDSLLGISPMSPSGIVLPPMVPLLIAEEDAVVTK